MKNARRLLIVTLVVLWSLPAVQAKTKSRTIHRNPACSQGAPYRNCPACGTVPPGKKRTLNVQKNRGTAVTNPNKITVEEIRDPAKNNAFNPSKKVWVTGFVANVDPGGLRETCNCKRDDLRDVHINIVANSSEAADPTKYVVVEFTPRWEKTFGFNDSNYDAMLQAVSNKIQGKCVKFQGWMLYDFIHADASQSTSPGNPVCPRDGQLHSGCNWRGTPWEVHPVTAYTVVSGP